MFIRNLLMRCAAVAVMIVLGASFAGRAAAGTYANITVQGEPAGTEFNDWVGIPVLAMDPVDNPGGPVENPFIDIKDVQIANNENFLFVRISYHNNSSTGTLVAIDNDQNVTTGFDIFSLGLIGSEIGYINDFPFAQATGTFNTNVSLTGGPFGNGGALIYPFWDQDGMDKEMAIPLDLMVTFPAAPGFPNDSMNIAIYTDEGLADITDVISYTLADPPAGVPGDYNNNGTVDAADYVVWRDGGPLLNEVAGVTPDTVTQEDYDAWRARFGNTAGAGGGSSLGGSAVPEPASVILLLGFAAALLLGIRRGWSPSPPTA